MFQVKLIASTVGSEGQSAEDILVHAARASNLNNQTNYVTGDRLLRYCIKHKHWSIFESASMTIEIKTSRAIARQILRHRTFTYQEFSARYAEVPGFMTYEARAQDTKNRQASHDTLGEDTKEWWRNVQLTFQEHAMSYYREALGKGIAKECARMILPESAESVLYMTGCARSWIHYFEVRRGNGTQFEHVEIADAAFEIFSQVFPITAELVIPISNWSVCR